MRDKPDKEHYIAIADCPGCGSKDIPLSTRGPFVKEGHEDIYISFCPNCDRVPYDESEIKGYVSIEELTAMGWQKEEG